MELVHESISKFHPYHLVTYSPWPLVASFSLMSIMVNLFFYFDKKGHYMFFYISVITMLLIIFQWWRDIVRESTYQGCHLFEVCKGLYLGMLLFILSEVMFFFSFFFSFFSLYLNPEVEIGIQWPPEGVKTFSYLEVPLLNTLILLSSGVSITWMHHSIMKSLFYESVISGFITVFLGKIFMVFQWIEYNDSYFSMADSIYGSLYFIMTGFHGLHVFVGMIFIFIELIRLINKHFSSNHHLGFEFSAWYWHFVDVVWLFLYICVYWLGS